MADKVPTSVVEQRAKFQSADELVNSVTREFIIMAGKDGAGKSCAVVSAARWVQMVLNPDATFWVIDTENKFPTALKSFRPDHPTNIRYFKCEDMNAVTTAMVQIMAERKEGDWVAVESMSRAWDKAQDMGYMAIAGYTKAEYLEIRAEQAAKLSKKEVAPLIPKPNDFWSVVKGAHDGAFLDLLSQASTLNVLLTTTVAKPPAANAAYAENATRKEVRAEFGMDVGIDGAPRLPYYAETFCLLDTKNGVSKCRVIRDNVSNAVNSRVEFTVADRGAWAQSFWTACR